MAKLKKKKYIIIILLLAVFTIGSIYAKSIFYRVNSILSDSRTVSDVVDEIGEQNRKKLKKSFTAVGLQYPPNKIKLLALKKEKTLELWASASRLKSTNIDKKYILVKKYKIVKSSGIEGPKLLEGDRQVPEGIYNIIGLNPNSSYHLSMKLNYPNEFDLKQAKIEKRSQPGSNIFIHGKDVSIGCLAMGDPTIEELFVLVNDLGKENVKVIISPFDFRKGSKSQLISVKHPQFKTWLPALYDEINKELTTLMN